MQLPFILVLISFSFLAACATTSPQPSGAPKKPVKAPMQAPRASVPPPAAELSFAERGAQAYSAGNYDEAARNYAEAARRSQGQEEKRHYSLLAASASIHSGRYTDALALAEYVLGWQPTPEERIDALWIAANAQRAMGKGLEALKYVNKLLNISTLTPELRSQAMLLEADLELARDRQLTGLTILVKRHLILSDEEEMAKSRERIQAFLDAQPVDRMERWLPRSSNLMTRDWIQYAILARKFDNPQERDARLAQWVKEHPNHPALGEKRAAAVVPRSETLCTLLPNAGRYESIAQAVLEGMQVASLLDPRPFPVILYNTAGNPEQAQLLYKQALQDGCGAFVGPLLRQEVVSVLQVRQPNDPPLLTLTPMRGAQAPNMLQFGLPPEQEMIQMADELRANGFSNVLLVHPQNDLGARLQKAFGDYWLSLGGSISGVLTAVDDAERSPEDLLASITVPPSQAIVFLGDAKVARQWLPPLRGKMGNPLVFAGSYMYAPEPTPELEGVMFLDMPWLLGAPWPAASLELEQRLPNRNEIVWRLAAMGLDAYTLGGRVLDQELSRPVEGVTGELSLAQDGTVQRRLFWARYREGRIEVLQMFPRAPIL